jgi:hypothetical protein
MKTISPPGNVSSLGLSENGTLRKIIAKIYFPDSKISYIEWQFHIIFYFALDS